MDIQAGYEAVAAAEVVAALCGRASQTLPDEVSAWVQAHPAAADEPLVRMAWQAVVRVTTDSDLKEERGDDWQAIMADLTARLEQCLTAMTSG